MNSPPRFTLDKRTLARAFGRASRGYDAAARLQLDVRTELLERLQYFKLDPAVIVDLGCGTGQGTAALRARFRRARLLAIDVAPGMLQEAQRRTRPWRRFAPVCADACALPLATASVDLVFSNLMMQWCDDLPVLLTEVRRVLRPGGLLLFSTFGPETLDELRCAWASVDDLPHVSEFADMPQLGMALMHAGLGEPVMDRELHRAYYPTATALMLALRAIGAGNAASSRRRALTGPRRLQRMVAAYEQQRTAEGLPVTWELIYGAAFGVEAHPAVAGTATAAQAVETIVPVSALRPRTR